MTPLVRLIAAGKSRPLAEGVALELGSDLASCELERFPDGELRPVVAPVRGDDVYLICSTGPPVESNLIELMLLLDACKRAGARRLTAVVPYFGYARQERRVRPGEPIGARLVAELLQTAGAERLVVVDPHTAGFEALSPVPTVVLSARTTLLASLRTIGERSEVVVAPDLGATKLAEGLGRALDLPVAIVRKRRLSGSHVEAEELVGQVAGRRALIVDDMIATGATIEEATRLLASHGALPKPSVVATHGLFVRGARERLGALDLSRLLVTDTLSLPADVPCDTTVCSIAPLLAETIRRLNGEERLDDLEGFG
jgi:ribose-phosphate pyrophosphokinase